MVLLKQLVLILMFNEFLVGLDAFTCPKGQRVSARFGNRCEACPEENYQPEENDSQQCQLCTECYTSAGSEIKKACTKETDTVCQCRRNFTPREKDSSFCKCDIGFGLSEGGVCSKCEDGYFSEKINTPCRKWKDCKSAGVKKNGTTTSDVTCNDELKSEDPVSKPPPQNKSVSPTSLPRHRPHEGAQTPRMLTAITTRAPRRTTSRGNVQVFRPPSTGNHNGMAFAILGIAGLLLILTAVTCKLHITPRWQKKTAVDPQTRDSMCRRPVEESGDGSQSSLKLNPEEP